MSVAFRASAGGGVVGTALVVAKPTGTVDGDVMLAFINARNTTAVTCTPPAGWTEIVSQVRQSAGRLFVYRKVASGEGASYEFTMSLSTAQQGVIASFSGTDPATPVNVLASDHGAASTSHVTPTVTTTVPDTLVVRAACGVEASGTPHTYTWPTSTEVADHSETGGGAVSRFLSVAARAQAVAGAAGTETATCSASVSFAAATIALSPPPAAATAKVRIGGAWVAKPIKARVAGAWV